uniref:Uncharacterized protein n=1 Tax=Anguilla anguilla TaxID=7936 RepID=A0A0E9TRZ2_ANGAN
MVLTLFVGIVRWSG